MTKHLARNLLATAYALATFLLLGPAFARPGGGGSFVSGGSGGGGGSFHSTGGSSFSGGGISTTTYSSSSSGGGGGIGALILIILVLVIVAYVRTKVDRATRSAILNAEYNMRQQSGPPPSLAVIQARDPNLTEDSIHQRVRVMSDILRDAWCGGDMRPARAFVSDGVYSRFNVQLGLMRMEGLRNVMSDASVLHTTLAGVSTTPPLDCVHIRITAQARDANIPFNSTPEQAQQALSRKSVEPYTEIWTLVRRQGATSKLQPTQVGKNCPSCGAPLDAAQSERLASLLATALGRQVELNVIVDPTVVGGLRVQSGPDVIDATVLARLADARRRLAS